MNYNKNIIRLNYHLNVGQGKPTEGKDCKKNVMKSTILRDSLISIIRNSIKNTKLKATIHAQGT